MVTVSALSLSCHLPVKLSGPVLPGQIPLNTHPQSPVLAGTGENVPGVLPCNRPQSAALALEQIFKIRCHKRVGRSCFHSFWYK